MECFRANLSQLPGCQLVGSIVWAKLLSGKEPSTKEHDNAISVKPQRSTNSGISILHYTFKHINNVGKDWRKWKDSKAYVGGFLTLASARGLAVLFLEELLSPSKLAQVDFKSREDIGYYTFSVIWSMWIQILSEKYTLTPAIVSALGIYYLPANTTKV